MLAIVESIPNQALASDTKSRAAEERRYTEHLTITIWAFEK